MSCIEQRSQYMCIGLSLQETRVSRKGKGKVHTCTHTHMHTHMHVCACMHTCVHTGMHVHMHAHMHAHVCMHMHTHTHVRTHAHACTHAHTCAHTHTHVHICARTHTIALNLCRVTQVDVIFSFHSSLFTYHKHILIITLVNRILFVITIICTLQ